MESIIVLYSYHHHNTEKVADAIAKVLGAKVVAPQQIKPEDLDKYDLVGFGSGIYGEKFHSSVLEFAARLPTVAGKKAFLFSTNGFPAWFSKSSGYVSPNANLFKKNHALIRERLTSKGYTIAGEFSCTGFNTNSFLIRLGGVNKGRPNAEDLKHAEEFARGLIKA